MSDLHSARPYGDKGASSVPVHTDVALAERLAREKRGMTPQQTAGRVSLHIRGSIPLSSSSNPSLECGRRWPGVLRDNLALLPSGGHSGAAPLPRCTNDPWLGDRADARRRAAKERQGVCVGSPYNHPVNGMIYEVIDAVREGLKKPAVS